MRKLVQRSVLAAGCFFAAAQPGFAAAKPQPARPNVLIIVADDLGYSDIGAFGGEIRTPHLDALAHRGARLSSFYTASACSPTRSMLLTGRDHHQAGLGAMIESIGPEQRGKPGYEGYVPRNVPMLAERLKASGYTTMMSGKWHLGKTAEVTPASRGFDQSFALLQGAHNHFGMDQSKAYRTAGAAPDYLLNGKPVSWPIGAYSADYFTNRMVAFLKQAPPGMPFFGYVAYTTPHWPLQAPPEVIARYKGHYDSGPAALATQRIERMAKLGLVAPQEPVRTIDDGWSSLSPKERALQARKMEIYAAMVDRMDQNIGRLIDTLRELGQLDNTVIMFMSDNGPEGLNFDRPRSPLGLDMSSRTKIDNSLANMGAGDSYVSYGPLWGQAGAAPYWGTKEHSSEGGIHSPAIVAGPGVAGRKIVSAVAHVIDVVPTVIELAQLRKSDFKGPDQAQLEGHSWLPVLAGKASCIRGADEALGWELFYRRAIRRGNMKAIYQPTRTPILGELTKPGTTRWQLYDLSADPGETRDLSSENPALLADMASRWYAYAEKHGVVLLDDEELPEKHPPIDK